MSTGTVSDPECVSVQEVTGAGPAPSPVPLGGGAPPAATPAPATTQHPVTPSLAPAPVRQAGGGRPVTSSVLLRDTASTARRSVNVRTVRYRASKGLVGLLYQ